MKSGSRRVFRYSSTHEKALPDGSLRRRMEIHRTPRARPHRTWTPQDPQSSRDPERRLLRPKERLPVAALAPRLPYRWPTVYHYFRKWRIDATWEHINRAIRERLRVRLKRDPHSSAGIVDSQSVKSTERWAGNTGVTTGARRSRALKASSVGGHRSIRAQSTRSQREGDGL